MSKTFVVGMTIAGAVGASFVRAFKTAEQRSEELTERQERLNKKLKAAGDVVKYQKAVSRLTAGQQKLGRSNERLDRALGEVTGRYRTAQREARSYGIEVGQVAREQRGLQGQLRTTARMQRGLRIQRQAGGAVREIRGRAVAAGAAAYGIARLVGRAFEREQQRLFLGTVINAPDRDAAVDRASAHAREAARTTLASESEMLEIEYTLNSAGLAEEVARASSGIVHRVATVTRGSAQQVGNVLGVAFNNLAGGMEGTAEEKMRQIGDVLTKTQFMFQIEDFGQLGAGMEKAAKAAVNYKVSLEQTAAAVGVLNSAGQQGSAAGTAFAATMRNLGKAAEEFGTEIVRDASGQLDLVATVGQLREALADLDTDERAAELQRVFGDEGLAGIVPLMEQLGQLGAGVEAVGAAARRGLVDAEYQHFLESTSGQWKIFSDNVALVGETFAGTLLPVLNSVLGPMTRAAAWTGSMIERFPALGYLVGGFAVGLGVMVTVMTAAAALGWIWGGAMAVLPGKLALATAATKAWTAAMWVGKMATAAFNLVLLANPIGLVVGAIVAAVAGVAYVVYRYWEPIKEFFGGLWDGAKSGLAGLRSLADTVGAAITAPWEAVKQFFGGLFGGAESGLAGLRSLADTVGTVITAPWEAVKQFFGGLFGGAESGLAGLRSLADTVGAVITAPWKVAKAFYGSLWDGAKSGLAGLRSLADTVGAAITAPWEAAKGFFGGLWDGAKSGLAELGSLADTVGAAITAPPPPVAERATPYRRAVVGAAMAGSLAAAAPAAAAPEPPAPRGPTTITVTVGDIVIQAPEGADVSAIAEVVRREMAAILREASVEAGLAEGDDAY